MTFLKKMKWLTLPFLTLTPLISIAGLAYYIPRFGIHPLEPIVCFVCVFGVALVVSGGYHRYFAHKTFQCHPFLKIVYLWVGAAAFQQSALVWAADHRMHHRYVDTDRDPYNIKKGFWWAHMGWLLEDDPPHRKDLSAIAPDLAQDKWVMWQHKYWIWLSLPLAVGLPLLLGFWIDRPLGMFLWAGILRIVITHQTTFTVNSIAHRFGTQPYSDENSARDVWWLSPLLCGENYHNYHHCFPGDYRNGIRWYHWDPSKWLLWLFSRIGLVKKLNRAEEPLILKARLEMDLKRVEKKWRVPLERKEPGTEFWAPLFERLIKMRQALLDAAESYARAKKDYAGKALQEKRDAFQKRWNQWRKALRWVYRGVEISGLRI